MGYSGARSWRFGMSWGTYRISLDDMNCTEGDWGSCSYTTSHNCVHDKDIFISCHSDQGNSSNLNLELSSVKDEKVECVKVRDHAAEVQEAGENLAIAILMLVCTVLVYLLVKKNAQIEQKDLQIARRDELIANLELIQKSRLAPTISSSTTS